MANPYETPAQSKVTLLRASPEDQMIWAMEDPFIIREKINLAAAGTSGPMLTLHRWTAKEISEFHTRFDNIANIEQLEQ